MNPQDITLHESKVTIAESKVTIIESKVTCENPVNYKVWRNFAEVLS
jgi:hypothetical protein